jgi:hypothetical protein
VFRRRHAWEQGLLACLPVETTRGDRMSATQKPGSPEDQRKALEESEKNAKRKQPENYKEAETGDKIVEIGNDLEDDPIKGIDPPPRPKGDR